MKNFRAVLKLMESADELLVEDINIYFLLGLGRAVQDISLRKVLQDHPHLADEFCLIVKVAKATVDSLLQRNLKAQNMMKRWLRWFMRSVNTGTQA